MCWFYFKNKITTIVETSIFNENIDKNVLACGLFPNATPKNELCCMASNNNGIELDQHGIFEVCNNLDLNI